MKYSVIIPAYQAEYTIARCLDSLLLQDHPSAEIIVVNDGSTDHTGKICRRYTQHYPELVYLEKENGGVSSARNLGLSHAQGEYILFVDSDDYVRSCFFAALDQHLAEKPDFLMLGLSSSVDEKELDIAPPEFNSKQPDEVTAFICSTLRQQLLNAPMAKAFRKAIIDQYQLHFDERLPIGEDKVFVLQYLVHAQHVIFIHRIVYYLSLDNQESLSRKIRPNLYEHILLEHSLLFDAVENSHLSGANRSALRKSVSYSYYRSAYTVIRELYKFPLSRRERLARIQAICELYAQRRPCGFCHIKHWLMSLPIRYRAGRLLDLAIRFKIKLRSL